MGRDSSAGFTLIEIVVAITVIVILAAFAVPRFAGRQNEMRETQTNALAGSLRGAAMLAHGMWMAQGGGPTITMDGQTITMIHGYPDRRTIVDALVELNGFTYDPDSGVFTSTGADTPASCRVTYTPPATANRRIDLEIDTSGC